MVALKAASVSARWLAHTCCRVRSNASEPRFLHTSNTRPTTSPKNIMPPVRTTGKNTAFKPPRRISDKSNTSDSSAPKAPAPRAPAAAASRPPASASRALALKPATTLISSDTELDDIENDNDEELEDTTHRRRSTNTVVGNDVSTSNAVVVPPASQNSMGGEDQPPIPPKLLNRLLHEGFQDEEMRIGKEAMAVANKYVETFVREALARAMYEREEADRDEGGAGDGFLQVGLSLPGTRTDSRAILLIGS